MRRTIIVAVTGITALLLAGCSASDPEEKPSPTTSSSSPSTDVEETIPDEEEGTPEESPSTDGMTKEETESLDEFADEMFLAVTRELGFPSSLSEEDRLAMGKEVCVKIESEDADFETLVSWAKQELELPEGAGTVFVRSAISTYCLEHISLVNDYEGIDMEDL